MKRPLPPYPIHDVLPELKEKLTGHSSVILAAEPGSGKTTIVPLTLLAEPWLAGKKIIILEPRRLAARMAAKRMSELAADRLGGLVGYRIRFDKKISAKTRIEVVTEGILTRMIQRDPDLADYGLVICDEFHLRSIQTDLALALCLDGQELREDLKILIMSATMESERVAILLGGAQPKGTSFRAPVITGQGRCFPVTCHYLPRPSTDYLVPRTVKAINRALAEHEGDILVFLPGAGEIRAVQQRLKGDFLCLPLYGNLAKERQDQVFAPSQKRRIILATPIAETSLTIEGVTVVIDSGLEKVPRFTPATGLTALHTVPISKASAEQRAGRAGRLGPGVCYRLWTAGEHHSRPDFLSPEIVGADLAPLLLEVLQWGVQDPRRELRWLDPPRSGQLRQARETLGQLGAVDSKGSLTTLGREIAPLPLHPRLALMLIRGREQGNGVLACRLAALLQNKDPLRASHGGGGADIEERLELLQAFEGQGAATIQARGADPSLCRRILQEAMQYQRLLGIKGPSHGLQEAGNLLAYAYPDRIAMKRAGAKQHLLSSGRGVILAKGDHLHRANFLVAAHADGGQKKQGRIFMAARLSRQDILENHGHLLHKEERVQWQKSRVEGAEVLYLGSLELERKPLAKIDPDAIRACLIQGIQQAGSACLGWQKKSRELQARLQAAHGWEPDSWPDVSDNSLLADLSWLEPYLAGVSTLKQLKKIDLYPILLALLSWPEQQQLDQLLPTHFQVPSGSRIKLTYQPGEPPVLAVRLQEMFGATATPTVMGGRVAIQIHLLSPARRPIQITQDLTGFWQNTYHEVKKELKGRYPKHYWPDDPKEAQATSRVRPRRSRG